MCVCVYMYVCILYKGRKNSGWLLSEPQNMIKSVSHGQISNACGGGITKIVQEKKVKLKESQNFIYELTIFRWLFQVSRFV